MPETQPEWTDYVHLRRTSESKRVVTLYYSATPTDGGSHPSQDQVQFVTNAPFSEILSLLSRASIGLSTMVDEHFGINVVEFMVCAFALL